MWHKILEDIQDDFFGFPAPFKMLTVGDTWNYHQIQVKPAAVGLKGHH
jgi:hypothetical protein